MQGGELAVTIVGRYSESEDSGEILQVPLAGLRTIEPDAAPGETFVRATPDTSRATLGAALRTAMGDGARVINADTGDADLGPFQTAFFVITFLVLLVGLANLVSSTALAVNERTRDLAVLRAVGFTPRQIRTSVAVRTATQMLTALAVGVPVGLIVGRPRASQVGPPISPMGPARRRRGTAARNTAPAPVGVRCTCTRLRRRRIPRRGSGQQFEIAESRAHDSEVPPVERGDLRDAKPFSRSDDGSVCGAKGKVSVLGDKFSDPHPVAGVDVFSEEIARCEITEKSNLGICAEARADEIGHFGDDQSRNDKGARMSLEQVEASGVVAVVAVDVGVERAGIDDQCDGCTSAARISSIRSEMSSRPLAPAPAASSRRLPDWVPRKVSIASRVSSDTVLPRRSASCRRRASSSSGSFTVVRCMYASILRTGMWRQGGHFAARIHDPRPPSITRYLRFCGAR